MKSMFSSLLILFPINSFSGDVPGINDVSDLVWDKRVILLWSDEHQKLEQQLKTFSFEIEDRDTVWFIIDGPRVFSSYSGQIFGDFVENTNRKYFKKGNKVVLIGKDGEIKKEIDKLELNAIFNKIDSMPMRIREMKEKSESDK